MTAHRGHLILCALGVTALLTGCGSRPVASPNPAPASVPASSVASVPSAPTPAETSETAEPSQDSTGVVEIGWVGDLTPGSKYGNPPDKGRGLFRSTRTYTVAPDIMVANLEGTFGTGGPSKCDEGTSSACFAFQAPPTNAAALAWAGFDVVNLANNHSHDYLERGLKSTRQTLKSSGIEYTGLLGTITTKTVNGTRIAFIGFSPYPWSPSIKDLTAAKTLVRKADKHADIVVVLMHAGAEGADKTTTPLGAEHAYGEFRGDPRAFSHAVIDAGADLVLGSGPHVVRGMERYRGRLVAYSLGNFAGWRNFGTSGRLGLSGLLTVRLSQKGRVIDGRWRSLRLTGSGVPKPDRSNQSAALVRRLSRTDFEAPVVLRTDGSFTF